MRRGPGLAATARVRSWHLADVTTVFGDVRFRGQSRHPGVRRQCLLMTLSGHRPFPVYCFKSIQCRFPSIEGGNEAARFHRTNRRSVSGVAARRTCTAADGACDRVTLRTSAAEWVVPLNGFRRGLSEAGFVEGRNVAIEYRWADGRFDRMPAMANDLVGRKVAVILVGGNNDGVKAVMAATHTIPNVFTTGSDPVASGLVASLNHPGGNVTGVTVIAVELGPKKVGLLREMLPQLPRSPCS